MNERRPHDDVDEFEELERLVRELISEVQIERLRSIHDAENRRRIEQKLSEWRQEKARPTLESLFSLLVVT